MTIYTLEKRGWEYRRMIRQMKSEVLPPDKSWQVILFVVVSWTAIAILFVRWWLI